MNRERRVSALLIVGLVAFFFGLAVAGDRGLFTGDLRSFRGARDRFLAESLRRGEGVPEWVPGIYGGAPGLASPELGLLYPPDLVLALVAGDRAEAAGLALHFLLGAFGTLALARRLGATETGALVAAVAFMFGGAVVSAHVTPILVAAAAWTVWTVWAAIGLGKGGDRWALPVATVSFVAIYLAGDPLNCIFAAVAAGLALAVASPRETPRAYLLLALAAVLAVILVAVELVPALAVLDQTARSRGGMDFASVTRWSFWPPEALGFAVPFLFGDHSRGESVWIDAVSPDHMRAWAEAYYVGAIVLALAVAGLLRLRESGLARAGAMLVAVFTPPALGKFGPLYPLVYDHLPGGKHFRYPAKLMVYAALGVALLAAAGLDDLQRRRRVVLGALVALLAVFLGGFVYVFAEAPSLAASIDALGVERVKGAEAMAALLPRLVHPALFALAGVLVLAWPRRRTTQALTVLVVLDLGLALGPAIYLAPREPFARAPRIGPILEDVAREDGFPARVVALPSARAVWPEDERAAGSMTAAIDLARLEGFIGNSGLGVGVLQQQGFLANPPLRALQLDLQLERAKLSVADRAIRSGARYVLVGGGEDLGPDVTVARTLESRALLRLERAPAWAALHGAIAYAASRTQAGKLVAAPTFDPVNQAVIEAKEEPCDPDAHGKVSLASGLPLGIHGFDLDVESSGPAWLVVREAWAPGWTASVNSSPAEVVPADLLFRGVHVQAGKSHVELRFIAPRARLGLVVSLVTAPVLLVLLVVFARRSSGESRS